ncbi:hypothetical protein PybrP1_006150 [[Pythium] brassicae (nom. inval.)]|nr:hypothetical protein PybrP1_006150 [[Pythium] brassicae (nom. inval.)]
MVRIEGVESQRCSHAPFVALQVLEAALLLAVLWRAAHHIWCKSHPRRVCFHLALLLSSALRSVFWAALCRPALLGVGLALLWTANSLLLLCMASIVFQWASAVAAGRVTAQEMQRAKKFGLHHPLVFLHSLHLLGALSGGVDAIVQRPGADAAALARYLAHAEVFLAVYRAVNVLTVAVDAACACFVARQLRQRLLSAAMTDEMKTKSVVQMTLLILCMTAALLLQAVMDVPVLVLGLGGVYNALAPAGFCALKYFAPAVLLSSSFLYIMRRVEQREPARLVVAPSQSLVEFEECAVPCVWCSHHRRFQAAKGKWDPTFLSPLTTDSSFRSAHSSTHPPVPHASVPDVWSATAQPRPVDEGFSPARFSPESERRYQQHLQHHHHGHGSQGRGAGAPYS